MVSSVAKIARRLELTEPKVPMDIEASRLEARRRWEEGDQDGALAVLESLSATRPDDLQAKLDFAARLGEAGRHNDAEGLYENIQSIQPLNFPALMGLARIARLRGQHDRALAFFSAARDADPANLWTLIECAVEQRALGRAGEARALYETVLERDPVYAAAHSGLGTLARAAGDRDAALRHFSAAREAAPANPWNGIECATELRALGRLDEADAICRDVLAQAPDYAAAHHGLGVSARQAGDRARALAHFTDARHAEPANLWNAIECVTELRALGRVDEAESLCREILHADPDHAAAHGALGQLERQRGHHRQALEHFERAAEHSPHDSWYRVECATELRVLGALDEAAERLRELGRLRPDLAAVDHGLGMIARQKRDHAAALAHFEDASRKDPGNIGNRLECAAELRSLGRFADAIVIYEEARSRDPGNGHVHVALGVTARAQGLHEEAAAHFQQAVSIQADNPYFRAEYGHELVGLGRLEEAHAHFLAACDMPGGALPGRRGLATLARLRGDGEEELALWQALDEGQPDNPQIRLQHIQRFSAICGPKQTIGRFFAEARAAELSSELAIEYAANLRLSGQIVAGKQVLEAATPSSLDDQMLALRFAAEARLQEHFALGRAIIEKIFTLGAPLPAAYLERARLLRHSASPEDVLENYRAAISSQPHAIEALAEALGYLREQNRLEEAVDLARAAEISARSHPRLFGQLIAILCDLGKVEQAKQLLEERRTLFPGRSENLIWAADVALAGGDVNNAFARIREAIDARPDNPEAWGRLAHYAALTDDYALAVRALSNQPRTRPELEATLSYYQSQLGLQDDALATLNAAEARYGEIPVLIIARCRILERIGLVAEASLLLSTACARYPDSADLLIYRVTLACRIGAPADAPNESACLSQSQMQLLLGHIAMRRRMVDAAIEHFELAAGEFDSPEIRRNLALMKMFTLDFPAARRELAKSMELEKRARQAKRQSQNASQSLYGQFVDEYRLDQATATKLREILSAAGETDYQRLLEVARTNPDSTLAAIICLLKLRQGGAFERHGSSNEGEAIPRRICQFWADEPPPAELNRYTESWTALNPGYEYRLFDTAEAEDFLKTHDFDEAVLRAFQLAREPAVKADILRLAYLYQHGGFYADIDDRCVRSLEHIRSSGATFFGYQEDVGSLANNVLGSMPSHPVIGRALKQAGDAVLRGDADMPWLSTGPGLLSRVFVQWLAAGDTTLDQRIGTVFFPDYPRSFEYFSIHCFASYKITPQHWGRRIFG